MIPKTRKVERHSSCMFLACVEGLVALCNPTLRLFDLFVDQVNKHQCSESDSQASGQSHLFKEASRHST